MQADVIRIPFVSFDRLFPIIGENRDGDVLAVFDFKRVGGLIDGGTFFDGEKKRNLPRMVVLFPRKVVRFLKRIALSPRKAWKKGFHPPKKRPLPKRGRMVLLKERKDFR